MRDKLLSDLIEIADLMAAQLSDEGGIETSNADREKVLKTWNTMRQAIGAPDVAGNRAFGEGFNSGTRTRYAVSKESDVSRILH